MLEEPRKMTLERDAWGTELRRAFDLSDPRKEAEQLMWLIRRGILVAEVRRTIIISPGQVTCPVTWLTGAPFWPNSTFSSSEVGDQLDATSPVERTSAPPSRRIVQENLFATKTLAKIAQASRER